MRIGREYQEKRYHKLREKIDWNDICDNERVEKHRDNKESKDNPRKFNLRFGRGRGRGRTSRNSSYKQQNSDYLDYPAEYPVSEMLRYAFLTIVIILFLFSSGSRK